MFAVNSHLSFSHSNPKIVTVERRFADVFVPCQALKGKCYSGYAGNQLVQRSGNKAVEAVLSGVDDIEVPSSSSSSVEDFNITASSPDNDNKLKISVEVSGTKTEEIYDKVFSKMVEDAQPIPGFRRVKGGKTPNIPKNILLEILGPSKVYTQVIKKVINVAISQYVAKEGLGVAKDLQIEQSLEDLEAEFEPGAIFRFDALLRFQDSK